MGAKQIVDRGLRIALVACLAGVIIAGVLREPWAVLATARKAEASLRTAAAAVKVRTARPGVSRAGMLFDLYFACVRTGFANRTQISPRVVAFTASGDNCVLVSAG